jgi:hypothetical protein
MTKPYDFLAIGSLHSADFDEGTITLGMNQHVAIKLAKVDIRRALAILELCPDLELDEQLKLSTLEGETQLTEIVSIPACRERGRRGQHRPDQGADRNPPRTHRPL